MGVEDPPFRFAGLFRVYGAEHAELRMGGLLIAYAVFRGLAVVNVPMPARDAERDALVQFSSSSVASGLAANITPSSLYSCFGVLR